MNQQTQDQAYQAYVFECKMIESANKSYLKQFEDYLKASHLKEKTIRRHMDNVAFYLNTYLLSKEPISMSEGAYFMHVDDYFGYFLITKCMWSTPSSIKSTATSIKKFYKCMLQKEYIKKDVYDDLVVTIKESMAEWINECTRFNTYY